MFCNDGRTPDANIEPIARGMAWLTDWFAKLADECGATVGVTPRHGTYPFPGFERLAMLEVESIPDFDARARYPHARALTGGTRADKGGKGASSTGGGVLALTTTKSGVTSARYDSPSTLDRIKRPRIFWCLRRGCST